MVNAELDMFDRLKYIGGYLENKKDSFALTLPLFMCDYIKEHGYVGGGSIYSMYNDGEYKDIDIFINSEKFANRLREYVMNRAKEVIVSKDITKGKLVTDESFAITKNSISIGEIQIVVEDIGEIEDVVSRFDFKHNMFWVDKGVVKTLSHTKYLDSKKLYFNDLRPRDIAGTIVRIGKYTRRGFTVSPVEVAKMLLKLNSIGIQEDELDMLKRYERFDS